jgi:serine/threonine protein phosphatase PrpC/CRP-like cAMP-binding protein
MRIIAAGQTDVGLERDHNEDTCLMDHDLGLYIVCDGMGGHAAGEVASQETARLVHERILQQRALLTTYDDTPTYEHRVQVVRMVEEAIQAACAHIHNMGQIDITRRGMGTTIAMLLTLGEGVIVAHVGDSRVYLLRERQAHQLTEDHSMVWYMLKAGQLSKAEVATWPYNNVITRSIGTKPTVQVDTLFLECMTKDRFLLCSDGFHNYLEHDADLVQMSAQLPLEALVKACIARAHEGGASDNVTVIVVQVDSVQRTGGEAGVSVMRKVDALKRIRLFSLCEPHELVRILNIVHVSSYEPGEVIVAEDTEGGDFFIMLSGKVEVLSKGQRLITLGPGAPFGETALLDRVTRSATVRALEATKTMRIYGQDFYAMLEQEPTMAVKLLRSFVAALHQRLRASNADLLATRGALSTLAHNSQITARRNMHTTVLERSDLPQSSDMPHGQAEGTR